MEVLGKALTLFHRSVLGPGLGREGQVLVNISVEQLLIYNNYNLHTLTSELGLRSKISIVMIVY